MEYNCLLIKKSGLAWLAACIVLRVVGAVLIVFLRHWRTVCTILQPMGCKGRYLKKCPKPCLPIRSKETWIKYRYTSTTYKTSVNPRKQYTFCIIKSFEQIKIFKNDPVLYLGLELTIQVIKSQIHLVRQSVLRLICYVFTFSLVVSLKVSILARIPKMSGTMVSELSSVLTVQALIMFYRYCFRIADFDLDTVLY